MTLLLTLFASIPLWLILLIWIGLTFVCLKRYGVKARTWYRCWGIALLASSCVGIPRQDYLECNLPQGNQIILTNQYQFSILGAVASNIGDVSARGNESGFKAYFKKKGTWLRGELIDSHPNDRGIWVDGGREACAQFNQYQIYRKGATPNISMLELANTPDFDYLSWELTPTEEEELKQAGVMDDAVNDERIKNEPCCVATNVPRYAIYHKTLQKIKNQKAGQYGVYDGMSLNGTQWLGKVSGTFWKEVAFETVDSACIEDQTTCPITAVWQVHSVDNGKTWSSPIITRDAKLFVIGKSILDQPAVAKPGKWIKGPG